jgi:undecaprenyl diphosphate synthase
MDGNGRWAKQKGEDRVFGHMNGVNAIRNVLEAAIELGVGYLTLYAFSTENWERPQEEVDALMHLLVKTLLEEVEELNSNGVRLNVIGNIDQLPENAQKLLKKSLDLTKSNSKITLTLALSYSARWEIVNAAKKLINKAMKGELLAEELNEYDFAKELTTYDMPDPEFLIRTSGEQRISNYLLWQLAYAEFYFTEELWPDFDQESFYKAIAEYQGRERRFGKISEQVQHD